MTILTYIVRTIMVLSIVPLSLLMYAMYQDIKTWGNE